MVQAAAAGRPGPGRRRNDLDGVLRAHARRAEKELIELGRRGHRAGLCSHDGLPAVRAGLNGARLLDPEFTDPRDTVMHSQKTKEIRSCPIPMKTMMKKSF